jgi:predicted nucleic-acid-binding protein
MLGVDTNVLVRLIVGDESTQHHQARALIELTRSQGERCRVDRVVLCELVWVLQRSYRYRRDIIVDAVDRLLRADDFLIDASREASLALADFRAGSADFADCLIARLNAEAGCRATATFDKVAADQVGFMGVGDIVHG